MTMCSDSSQSIPSRLVVLLSDDGTPAADQIGAIQSDKSLIRPALRRLVRDIEWPRFSKGRDLTATAQCTHAETLSPPRRRDRAWVGGKKLCCYTSIR